MSKNLLVIGAGYVGSEVVRQAVNAEWNVIGVTKNGGEGSMGADVSSRESLSALKQEIPFPSVIIHCASSGRGGAIAYETVFYEGVKNLLLLFPSVPIVFVSSTSVYAQENGETVTEESETLPSRETGKILLKSESLVRSSGGIVARLAGIYGPERSVLLKKLLNETAVIEEDGRRIINQIHRDDAASALLFLAERVIEKKEVGECFNVCDSYPRSQRETYEGLCERFHFSEPPIGEIDHNRKRGWTHKAASNAKLRSIGWSPLFPDFLTVASQVLETLK